MPCAVLFVDMRQRACESSDLGQCFEYLHDGCWKFRKVFMDPQGGAKHLCTDPQGGAKNLCTDPQGGEVSVA